MIMTFNLIHHHLNLDSSLFFTPSHTSTRGHQFKLYKPRCSRDVYHHVFSHRIINQWNSLPQETVNAANTNTLNNSLTLITQMYYMLTVTFYKYRSGITGIEPFIVPALMIIIGTSPSEPHTSKSFVGSLFYEFK